MTVRIINADVMEGLRQLPDESVHCVVTSPPYWRQRDYGKAGQIGLEQTPEEYIERLVPVFRDVRRILRSDGSLWCNIGDKWASGGKGGGGSFMAERGQAWAHAKDSKGWRSPPVGYKDKDLVGVPWMLAFALRADGWYLRQCNVWAKPNCMPESVRDRSTVSHEYVFHLTKNNDYFYDCDAARTPPAPATETRLAQDLESQEGSLRANGGAKTNGPMKAVGKRSDKQRGHTRKHAGFNDRWDAMERDGQMANGANLRSVWWISPASYDDGHFAVMPDKLAEICIVAGCPKGGTVLDPFGGAGTTGLVADRLQRNAILLELNPEYAAMSERRINGDRGALLDLMEAAE
jgi:DNA modification methylase